MKRHDDAHSVLVESEAERRVFVGRKHEEPFTGETGSLRHGEKEIGGAIAASSRGPATPPERKRLSAPWIGGGRRRLVQDEVRTMGKLVETLGGGVLDPIPSNRSGDEHGRHGDRESRTEE
jgi:hypothetical protein